MTGEAGPRGPVAGVAGGRPRPTTADRAESVRGRH